MDRKSIIKKSHILSILSITGLVGLLAIFFITRQINKSSYSADQDTSSTSNTTKTQKTPSVKIYFSKHPDSDDYPSKVFAVDREALNSEVAKYSVSELIKGPSELEVATGYFTSVRLQDTASTCDNQDFKISIKDLTATLQFCRKFDHFGAISDGQAENELSVTLLQFPTIKKVVILNVAGDCEFNLSGQNLCKQ